VQGHSHIHVGSGDVPILEQHWRKKLTTMYRNRTQAEKDLRDLLNRHIAELHALPNGKQQSGDVHLRTMFLIG
jgi:hypothetical protein